MRRTLGTLALLPALALSLSLALALSGCGDDAAGRLPEGTSGSSGSSGSSTPATLVSATAGGGHPASTATRLPDDAALTSYVAQFSDAFAAQVRQAAGAVHVADGHVLVAQVVAVGCDTPPSASVSAEGGDVVIVAAPVASPRSECFAPVTTVGLGAVDAVDGATD